MTEPLELAAEEPTKCFSPERRFDEKERRERPPRRYDKVDGWREVAEFQAGD